MATSSVLPACGGTAGVIDTGWPLAVASAAGARNRSFF